MAYTFTSENKNQFLTEGGDLLTRYGHSCALKGMTAIWNTFAANKGKGVASVLSQHPNWEPDIMAVHLTEEYSTSINTVVISDFVEFLKARLCKWGSAREIKVYNCTYGELHEAADRLRFTISQVNKIPSQFHPVRLAGKTEMELQEELERIRFALHLSEDRGYSITTPYYDIIYLTFEDRAKFRAIREVISLVENFHKTTIEEYEAETLNNAAKPFLPRDSRGEIIRKFRANPGQKTSKVIRKYFALIGEGFTDYKNVQEHSWIDQDGNTHIRQKDMGWNYQFAAYSDAINPIKVKRHTFISVNPLDYLTMSFGNGWSSCHTIDYKNNRSNNDDNHFHGQYQSGCLSYMLDETSMVMYTTREDIDASRPWKADKINRNMFHFGRGILIQGRCYPDGRDSSDEEAATSISSCMRSIMQRVLSECLGETNSWTLRHGTDYCCRYSVSLGTNYRDYAHYEDSTISFFKGTEPCIIEIGHSPICPVCGTEHRNTSTLHCSEEGEHECDNENEVNREELDAWEAEHLCAECGALIDESEFVVDEDTGRRYCDSNCALRDGVYFCVNVCEFHSLYVQTDENGDYVFSGERRTN